MQWHLELLLGDQIEATVSCRIQYAFEVFCAVYGFSLADSHNSNTVRLCYGVEPSLAQDVPLTVAYVARSASVPVSSPFFCSLGPDIMLNVPSGTKFPCFHHKQGAGYPDWLGELFEWISGAHEHAITELDSVERVQFADTLHGKYNLAPEIPYAAIAMRGLNTQIRNLAGEGWPDAPISPLDSSFSAAVIASHDLDFLPVSFTNTTRRFFKNVIIAGLVYHDLKLMLNILKSGLRPLWGGLAPYDCLPLMTRREQELGIKSTCFVICRHVHRRDAKYELNDPKTLRILEKLAQAGNEIATHGSYTSLDKEGCLAEEYRQLAQAGYHAAGGRQHWLKYNGSALFDLLKDIGVLYDTTVGYPFHLGFRHGACFPYPPYDFANETPYPFLEIPLAIMDTALYSVDKKGSTWRQRSEQILANNRAYGWGGVSVLWHNDVFNGARLPRGIADLYWQIKHQEDAWISAKELSEKVWSRYASVGLLPARIS